MAVTVATVRPSGRRFVSTQPQQRTTSSFSLCFLVLFT